MLANIKRKTFELIDPSHAYDDASRTFNLFMIFLIITNVLVVILETEESLNSQIRYYFHIFDTFSVVIFTIEYALRLWTCTEDPKYKSLFSGRVRFAITWSMLIDLVSILPFYIPLLGVDLRFIRAIRLFRLFRLLKMGRYSQSLTTLADVLKSKKEELSVTLFAGGILLIISSSLMYIVEHEVQPEVFSSIPSAMWWGVITLTTVGYGDIYPKTVLGKFIGAFIAVLGIGLFAMPAGIIASGFASNIHHKTSDVQICPHCGKDITRTQVKDE
jgi:voltage-gated potassium channel